MGTSRLAAVLPAKPVQKAENAFYMKPAAAVVSARRVGTTATFDQLNKYFTIQEMPVVSSRYWNMVHGASAEQVKQERKQLK